MLTSNRCSMATLDIASANDEFVRHVRFSCDHSQPRHLPTMNDATSYMAILGSSFPIL